MDFRNDHNVWNINNEFMFGRSLLVAPVLEAKYTPERAMSKSRAGIGDVDFLEAKSTKLYLPAGTSWYDYETMEKFNGGQEIERSINITYTCAALAHCSFRSVFCFQHGGYQE